MNFEQAFKVFKDKYMFTPRVVNIIENQFGGEDITVLYYDKYIKTPPFDMSSWEGYYIDIRGAIYLRDMWESMVDQIVLNDPVSWEQEVKFLHHYKSVCKMIANYELRK